jgi:crossover junction endodeoxyribonuclease RusA
MDESSRLVNVTLPWPPSVNQYWRRNGATYFISKKGNEFRAHTVILCHKFKGLFRPEEKLSIVIEAYPPDKRRRDLDNVLKSLLDSLQHAGVYEDDYQIDSILITRQPQLNGCLDITLSKMIGIKMGLHHHQNQTYKKQLA